MGNKISAILEKVFEAHENTKKIHFLKNKNEEQIEKPVSFLNNRFQAIYAMEKHFVNVYRVYDQKTNKYVNLKLVHITNEASKHELTKLLDTLIQLSNQINPGLVKIEGIYFDDYFYSKNTINLLIIEEAIDFITFKDLIFLLLEELKFEFKEKISLKAEWIVLELVNLFILLNKIIEYIHKHKIYNVNGNLFNTLIVRKTKSDGSKTYKVQFSDLEIPIIFQYCFKDKIPINHYYFDTLNNSDSVNLLIIFVQITYALTMSNTENIFSFTTFNALILTNKINNQLNDEFFQFFLEKILNNILNNSPDVLSKQEFKLLNFYKMLNIGDEKIVSILNSDLNDKKLLEKDLSSSSRNKTQSLLFSYIKLIFITLKRSNIIDDANCKSCEILPLCFLLLNNIKKYSKEEFLIFFTNNSHTSLYLLIQKYIILIQNNYKILKLDMFEILNIAIEIIFSKATKNFIIAEYINNLNTAGIFSLILSYVNNCEVDCLNFLSFIGSISQFNTLTIATLLEKINFNLNLNLVMKDNLNISMDKSKVSNNLSHSNIKSYRGQDNENETFLKLKSNLYKILNLLDFNILRINSNVYHIDDVLSTICNFPLTKRRKSNTNEIINFLSELVVDRIDYVINEETFKLIMATILSLLIYSKSIKASFLFSTCISASLENWYYDPYKKGIFSEFCLYCKSCNLTICIICCHRCHSGHNFIPLGYSKYECGCNISNKCVAIRGLDIPYHVKKSYVNSIQEHFNYEENKSKSGYSISEKNSDFNIGAITESPSTSSNIFVTRSNETITIQTKNPICQVIEVTQDNEILLEITEDTLYYYEAEIILGGYYDQIAIGVTTIESFPPNEFAGYLHNSIGYHGDDGKCYVNSISYSYGVKFGTHDIIGCGITMSGNVYFTHNGCILPLLDIKLKGNIFSIISLRGNYSSVKINQTSQPPFVFKHHKQKFYKNPLKYSVFSTCVALSITQHESFLKFLNNSAVQFKYRTDITKLFKKYCLIMHSVCKLNKRHLIKYFTCFEVKFDREYINGKGIIEEVEEELKISPKMKIEMRDLEIQKSIDININRQTEIMPNLSPINKFGNNYIKITNTTKEFIKKSDGNESKSENNCGCKKGNCTIY